MFKTILTAVTALALVEQAFAVSSSYSFTPEVSSTKLGRELVAYAYTGYYWDLKTGMCY